MTGGSEAGVPDFHLETIGPSGDCAVLRVTGEVDVYTAPTGLGVLVGGLKRLRGHGGSLSPVINAAPILRILQITGLTRVLPPRPSIPDAIDADPHWRQTVESEAGSTAEWCRQHGLL
jgi:anti-sigma B factor antagonist